MRLTFEKNVNFGWTSCALTFQAERPKLGLANVGSQTISFNHFVTLIYPIALNFFFSFNAVRGWNMSFINAHFRTLRKYSQFFYINSTNLSEKCGRKVFIMNHIKNKIRFIHFFASLVRFTFGIYRIYTSK